MKRQEGKNKVKKKLKEEDEVKQNYIIERRRRRGEAIKTRKRQRKMRRIGHEIINREMKNK